MQREILFKAKRKDNHEWVYGDLIQLLGEQGKGRKFIIDNRFGACIDNKGNFINTESPFVNEVIPETVSQYTGLKDMNDVKIFENDYIKFSYDYFTGDFDTKVGKGIVKFYDGAFYIAPFEIEDKKIEDIENEEWFLIYHVNLEELEIIGNISDEEVK